MGYFGLLTVAPVPPAPTLPSLGTYGAAYLAGPAWCFKDAAETLPCAVGDPIYSRKDSLGVQPSLVQATLAKRPILRQDARGWYYVEWDGVDDKMACSPAAWEVSNNPLVLAMRCGGGSGNSGFALRVGDGATQGVGILPNDTTVGGSRAGLAYVAGTAPQSEFVRSLMLTTSDATHGWGVSVNGNFSAGTNQTNLYSSGPLAVETLGGGTVLREYGIYGGRVNPDVDGTTRALLTYMAYWSGHDGPGQTWNVFDDLTYNALLAAMTDCRVYAGSWVDAANAPATLAATFDNNYAGAKSWCNGYDGQALASMTVTGDRIYVTGTHRRTECLDLSRYPGVALYGTGTITSMRDVTATWTRPNAGTYPNVWKSAGDYSGPGADGVDATGYFCGGDADGVWLTPVQAANLAAAMATLNATAGTQYADSAGFYVHSATDPNTGGVAYRATRVVAGTTDDFPGLVAMVDGLISGVTIESGPLWGIEAGRTHAQYCVATTGYPGGGIVVIDGATIKGGAKHAIGHVSNAIRGMTYVKHTQVVNEPAVVVAGDYAAIVAFYGGNTADPHHFLVVRDTKAGTVYSHAVMTYAIGYQVLRGSIGQVDMNNIYAGESEVA